KERQRELEKQKEEEAAREREKEARRKAEEAAKERQRELAKQKEEEAAREREIEARRKAEEVAKERQRELAKQKEEEAAREREKEARRKAEEAAKKGQRELAKQKEERVAREREMEARRKAEEVAKERQRELAKQKEEKVIIQSKDQLNNIQYEKGGTADSRSRHSDTNTKSISIKIPKIRYIFIGVASIMVIVFAGFVFSTMKNSKAETTANSSIVEVNSNLVKGLRLSSVQKYQDAALEFEKIDYKTLGKDDKKAVLFTYLLGGKAQKAIDLEPDFAESIVSYYIAIDNLKKVKELKTKNPLINFEIAAIDNKHEEVIKLKEKVPLDGRREGIIVNSYLKLNQSEEAKKFAQKVGNKELLEKIDNNNTPNNSATSVAKINAN
ncbi:hypothetical protein, partial [Bacillus cereus]|uniref:hypothetical protein n=1 Tax=Bacillus cereus TaxID=1396 RepID=UPI000BFA49AA